MSTPRRSRAKPVNPDAITRTEAATILGVSENRVGQLRRDGKLRTLDGYPSYSRADVAQLAPPPGTWLNTVEAAALLGVSHTRVSQLAESGRIPVHHHPATGRRIYLLDQLLVVDRARQLRADGGDPHPPKDDQRPRRRTR